MKHGTALIYVIALVLVGVVAFLIFRVNNGNKVLYVPTPKIHIIAPTKEVTQPCCTPSLSSSSSSSFLER